MASCSPSQTRSPGRWTQRCGEPVSMETSIPGPAHMRAATGPWPLRRQAPWTTLAHPPASSLRPPTRLLPTAALAGSSEAPRPHELSGLQLATVGSALKASWLTWGQRRAEPASRSCPGRAQLWLCKSTGWFELLTGPPHLSSLPFPSRPFPLIPPKPGLLAQRAGEARPSMGRSPCGRASQCRAHSLGPLG